MTRRADTLRPLQQGRLDGLCGVYATINAIRLLAARRGRRIDCRALFIDVLDHTDRTAGIFEPLTEGIDTQALAKILKATAKTLARDYRLPILVHRPFIRRTRMSIEDLHAAMASDIAANGAVFILATRGRFDHWTVVHRASAAGFFTFDSYEGKRISLAKCSIHRSAEAAGQAPLGLALDEIFRLTPLASSTPETGMAAGAGA